MTPKERAAIQQALEALESCQYVDDGGWGHQEYDETKTDAAITALREALAEQAEQELVHWVVPDFGFLFPSEDAAQRYLINIESDARPTPCYAAPVRTKDLTDDEIMKINVDTASIVPTCDRHFHFARAVIAADREKNK